MVVNICRELACSVDGFDLEEVYFVGFFYDVGEVMLVRLIFECNAQLTKLDAEVMVAIVRICDFYYVRVGVRLFESWKMPSFFCRIVCSYYGSF